MFAGKTPPSSRSVKRKSVAPRSAPAGCVAHITDYLGIAVEGSDA